MNWAGRIVIVLALSTVIPIDASLTKEDLKKFGELVLEKIKEYGPTVAKFVVPIIVNAVVSKIVSSIANGKRSIEAIPRDVIESQAEQELINGINVEMDRLQGEFDELVEKEGTDKPLEKLGTLVQKAVGKLKEFVEKFKDIFAEMTGYSLDKVQTKRAMDGEEIKGKLQAVIDELEALLEFKFPANEAIYMLLSHVNKNMSHLLDQVLVVPTVIG
ncbi:uncharacterized protein LOC141902775 isoform X2 [Tubulanus polymorphus]|uniref:uncharacterized protein LOC141902775 isoform X2 n=1 Tax=Tubulanus polymorphus TaxID=672921 RepID=UPI003DA50AD6